MSQWTDEQYPIITSQARLVRVNAYAGTGKTTTLVGYAEHHSRERICYIAYNAAVAKEAQARFPSNVRATTSHALAFRPLGSQYQHKRANNLRLTDIAKALKTQDWDLARDVVNMLNTFLCSPDTALATHHLKRFQNEKHLNTRMLAHASLVMGHAATLWERMCDKLDASVPMTHDGYLKAWLLSHPDLSSQFDTILLDEAQDTNKLLTQFVHQQHLNGCKVILVGDRHQQLYRFRGADNALDEPWLEGAETHYLTRSFRFGFGVAHVANAILALKGETVPVMGCGARTQIKSSLPEGLEHRTFLYRTVAGVIDRALACLPLADQPDNGERIFWVGGVKKYQLEHLVDLYWYSKNQPHNIRGYQLTKDYTSFAQYREIAEKTEDIEMNRMLKIIETYGDRLPVLIRKLEDVTVVDEMLATVTLSTGHGSKGLEWPVVQLGDDFIYDPLDRAVGKEQDLAKRNDELNLYYVVATRAKEILAVNARVISMLRHAKELREEREQALNVDKISKTDTHKSIK